MPYNYNGRTKITIPVTVKQFNENPIVWIKKYIGTCISKNEQNKQEAIRLKEIYKGDQEIKNKKRLDGNADNNHQIVVNHIFRQVEFKKGFMVGKPIEYALATSTLNTDDMTFLNKYLRDSNKSSKDIDKYEQLYISGVAQTFIMPKNYDFDVQNEAPFILSVLEEGNGFVVYSNDITGQPLFNVVVSEHTDLVNDKQTTSKVYDIYYIKESDGYCYTFSFKRKNNSYTFTEDKEYQQTYKFLPITEFCLNRNRMGIVELVVSIQDFLNDTKSNQLDGIVDFINSYLVFENQNFKSPEFLEVFQKLKKERVLGISTASPDKPAKVSLLKDELQNEDINSVYNATKNEMYDITATPLSSGNVTSGGDTGQARLLGNGWETAQNQAGVDTTYLTQYEYSQLKKIIQICKDTIDNPINEISASDIEIKYSINMSNNLLVKAQALKYLYDMNMPFEEALVMVGLTGDTHGVGNKWKENDDYKKQLEFNQEQQKNNSNNEEKFENDNNLVE